MSSRSASTSDPPGTGCWLVRDGHVLASLEIPSSRRERARGLLGRDGIDGAMLLRPARSVHTIGMSFAIDVAQLDAEGIVVHRATLAPWRLLRPRRGVRSVLEAEAGTFAEWDLRDGDELEVRGGDDS